MLRDSRPGNGTRKQRRTHLEFSPLEARDCPAVITWLGGAPSDPNNWGDGTNWSSGTVPGSTDDG